MKSAKIATAQLSIDLNNAQPGYSSKFGEEMILNVRSGKTRYTIKQSSLAEITRKLATVHRSTRGAYKRVKQMRLFPVFHAGMTTAEYISRFQGFNQSAYVLPIDFDAIGHRRAALYENGALDFDVVEEANDDYIAEQAAQDVAQVVADAVAAVAIVEAMAPSESRELVMCEAGENEAHDVSMGSASGFTVAAYDRVTGLLANFKPAGKAPDPTVTEFLEVADPPVVEFLPDTPSMPDIYASNITGEVFYSTPKMKIGKHEWITQVYQSDYYGRCTRSLWRFTEGEQFKDCTIKYPGTFGPKTYRAQIGVWHSDKLWPSYDSNDGSSGLPKTLAKLYYANESAIQSALKAPASAPNSEGERIRSAADKMREQFPAIAAKYDDLATSHDLKDERDARQDVPIDAQRLIDAGYHPTVAASIERGGLSAYGPMAQAEIVAKMQAAGQTQDVPAVTARPTIKSKSGHWSAVFYMRDDGMFCMRFYGWTWDDMERAYPTASERMQALTAMGRAADAAMTAPDAMSPPVAEFLDAVPPPVAEFLGEPAVAASPEFERVKPVRIDLADVVARGVKPASLIGLGVYCSGDRANPSDSGAITGFDDSHGLTVEVTMESGQVWRAVRSSHFLDGWFSLDAKMHGAPYLAQLAGTAAALKASESSAKEQADKARAQALIDLAAQYPQLKRAENSYQGGKLAAVNMRILLKEAFKGQKFSVTSEYRSVRVGWEDGPTTDQVDAVIGRFDIGASDTQADYFYTVSTAFSDLFGGVQYLTTSRHSGPAAITEALASLFGADGPTFEDYKQGRPWNEVAHGSGEWSGADWHDSWYWMVMTRRTLEGKDIN